MAEFVAQLFFTGVMIGAVYALIALSLHIVFNATGLLNFAQGELVVWGTLLLHTFWQDMELPLGIAILFSVGAVTLIGIFIQKICVYPTAGMAPMVPMIACLFAGIALQAIAFITWGTEPKGIPYFTEGPPIIFLSAVIIMQYFWIAGVGVVSLIAINVFFKRVKWGRAMVGNADNPVGAKIIGVDASRVSLFAFIISAALGALAGVVIGPITGARPELGIAFTLKGFAASIIGGLNSTAGVVIGGLFIGLLETFVGGMISSQIRDILILALIIAGLMVRPWGLLGHEESERKHF